MPSLADQMFSAFAAPLIEWDRAVPILYGKNRGKEQVPIQGVFERAEIIDTSPNTYGRTISKGGKLWVERTKWFGDYEPLEGDEFFVNGEQFNVVTANAEGEIYYAITGKFTKQIETSMDGLRIRSNI
jgi:hypothetical protein